MEEQQSREASQPRWTSLADVMNIPDLGDAEMTRARVEQDEFWRAADQTPYVKCTGTFDAVTGYCDSCAAIDYERRGVRHE